MTRPSFLSKKMSFKVPSSWSVLSQMQLRYIIKLYSIYDGKENAMSHIKTAALFRFMGVDIDSEQEDGILCKQPATKKEFLLDPEFLPWMIREMDWLEHPELMTDRVETLHGFHAVDFKLRNVMFGKYLITENYFQGWLASSELANVGQMFRILYQVPEDRKKVPLTTFDFTAVILWWSAVKTLFGQMFPHFLKPGEGGEGEQATQAEVFNAQVRLLTKGDVTKEDEILNHTTTLRALTELDAQAREAEELDRMTKKK